MPDPTDIPVPPGEYAIPGLGRLLVIEGAARLKAPSGPVDLASLLAGPSAPVPPAGPDPSPADGKRSPWITALLAILALLAGTQLPAWSPDAPPAPVPAAPVEPAKPDPPAPKPPEPARPDWLPEPEGMAPSAAPVPTVQPSAYAPVQYVRQPEPVYYYIPAGAPCPPGYCPVR